MPARALTSGNIRNSGADHGAVATAARPLVNPRALRGRTLAALTLEIVGDAGLFRLVDERSAGMAYGIVHHFPGGTKEQYEVSIAAAHPSDGSLPEGQVFHAAGPSADGWTIIA